MQNVGHRCQLGERLRELTRVLDEGLHIAEAHRARRDAEPADHSNGDVVEVAEEHHRRLDDAGDELSPEARRVQLLVLVAEPLFDVVLTTEHLDQRVPGERLFDLGIQGARVPPLGDEPLLGSRGHEPDDRERRRDCDRGDGRQQR